MTKKKNIKKNIRNWEDRVRRPNIQIVWVPELEKDADVQKILNKQIIQNIVQKII